MKTLEELNSKWYWRLVKVVYSFLLLLSVGFIIFLFWFNRPTVYFFTDEAINEREVLIDTVYEKNKNKEVDCQSDFIIDYNIYQSYRNRESFFNPFYRVHSEWALLSAYASTNYCGIHQGHSILSHEREKDYFYAIKFTILSIAFLLLTHLLLRNLIYYIVLGKIKQ